MYLADFTLYFIEAIVFQMSFTDFAVWEVEAASTQSVSRSRNATVCTRSAYAIPQAVNMYNHA